MHLREQVDENVENILECNSKESPHQNPEFMYEVVLRIMVYLGGTKYMKTDIDA